MEIFLSVRKDFNLSLYQCLVSE